MNEKVKGIRLTVVKGDDDNTAFLDMEDLASFSAGLAYLSDQASKMVSASREYTEVSYMAKDNFEAGYYRKGLNNMHMLRLSHIRR